MRKPIITFLLLLIFALPLPPLGATDTTAEYWDNPSSTVASVVSFVSAIIEGERADWGENKKLDLR